MPTVSEGTSIPKMDSIQLLKAKVLSFPEVPIPPITIPLIDEECHVRKGLSPFFPFFLLLFFLVSLLFIGTSVKENKGKGVPLQLVTPLMTP